LASHNILLLADRRDRQMRQLFTAMHNPTRSLHRLLVVLENCVQSATDTLRNR